MTATVEIDATALIDVRDETAVVRDLVVCLCLACSSPILPRDERVALGELAMLVREKLEAVRRSLDQLSPPQQLDGNAVTSGDAPA